MKGRGKIQQLAELTAVEHMQSTAEEQRKNQEAESSWVRKKLWGSDETVKDEDEMRQTVLGDINHPAPIIIPQPQQQSMALPLVAALIAGPLIAGGGALAGYMLSDKKVPPTIVQPANPAFSDETISIGLGRAEDYTKSQQQ